MLHSAPSFPAIPSHPTPILCKHPQLQGGSHAPHPGSGAWHCSTGPDYRCSGSCPQDGSQGHTGNPPGLRPERGGPHPSGKPSHFPGPNMTWSRCGLWRDMKNEKERHTGEGSFPLKSRGCRLGLGASSILLCRKSGVQRICLSSFHSSPNPGSIHTLPTEKRKKHFHGRNPRWSYKNIEGDLFKVSGSGRFPGSYGWM